MRKFLPAWTFMALAWAVAAGPALLISAAANARTVNTRTTDGSTAVVAKKAVAKAVDVKDVQLSSKGNVARATVQLSATVKPTIFSLPNPNRVVVDFPNTRLRIAPRVLPAGRGSVRQVRVAERKSSLRMVFNVAEPVRARSFFNQPAAGRGSQLIITFTAANPPAARSQTVGSQRADDAYSNPASTPSNDQLVPIKLAHRTDEARAIVIAIDAGHGGEDPGATGKNGTHEKDVTLAIAKQLKDEIDREPGMRAFLTRTNDTFIPLRDRIIRARRQQADMFVSIHADSYVDRSVTGSSVYILSSKGATNEAARWLAAQENAADLIGGVKLDNKNPLLASVLLDVSQDAAMGASMTAAEGVIRQLNQVGDVRRRQVQQAGFVVLKSPDIPSMLIETAYISNSSEEAKLGDPRHQQRLAEAICSGVRNYFTDNPPPGTRFAQLKSSSTLSRNTPFSNSDTAEN